MYCKKKRKNKNVIIILIIFILLGIHITFKFFNEKAMPIFIEYSEVETKKIISKVIVDLINNEVLENINSSDLFYTTNESGKLETFDLNSKYINSILNEISVKVDNRLLELEQSNSVFKLPSGIIFNNNILSNIFPKIPIKLDIVSNALCIINTKIESYGINNALFKLNIDVSVDAKILMPFTSKTTSITTSIPIVIKLIEGNIPGYFLGGYYNNSFSN